MDQVGEKPEKRDVSKQTLIVLVILAVVVSLLGTFTVLKETSGIHKVVSPSQERQTESAQGTISLSIVGAPAPDLATGMVSLKIV
ncbi:MAG: hypothetical protein WC758_04530 [Candidatus Woesearchaeota archaeon]|jgi:hypothetical protein